MSDRDRPNTPDLRVDDTESSALRGNRTRRSNKASSRNRPNKQEMDTHGTGVEARGRGAGTASRVHHPADATTAPKGALKVDQHTGHLDHDLDLSQASDG